MAGLILTLSVIFVIAGGFLTRRLVVRMNRLENRVNIIVHELSKTEQPLLGEIDNQDTTLIGSVSDIRLNANRTKIPVTIQGVTYLVYDDSTIEEFVKEVGNPDKTYGEPDVYTLVYYSSITRNYIKVNFVDNKLTEIEHM